MTPHRTLRKAGAVLRRWLLPVLVLAVLGGWAGQALAARVPPAFTAETVLVVPPISIGQPGLGAPSDAARLAETYVASLAAGQQLRAVLAESTGAPSERLREGLTAAIDDGTSVVRIGYTGPTEDEVLAVLAATTAIVTGPTPPSPVQVGTLQTLSTPAGAASSGVDDATGALAGAAAGLLLGAVAAWAAERSRARADVTSDLQAAVPCPVSDWRRPPRTLVEGVVRHWVGASPRREAHVGLLGVGRVPQASLQRLGQLVASVAPDGELSLHVTTTHAGDRAAEQVARASDAVVLVVRRGTPVAKVEDLQDALVELGVPPTWALLVPARVRLPQAAAAAPAPEQAAAQPEPELARP